jgi:predicted P-loop ATPase
LQSLKWDGKERIDNWMVEYLKAEDCLYIRTIGKIVLCAAVRRIFHPGEKFDYLMVLEGAQRIGKSRVCEALGGEFHIGLRLDPHNKDMVAYMQSKWIVEIEEMDFATKAEAKAIKAFLSRRTDRIRVAYGRVPQDYPRQSIFIGTYNPLDGESQYLNDPTGNTRFWPVSLPDQKIDVERIIADRDQFWAEAVVKSKDCKLYLDTALETVLADIQHVKKEMDVWQETIEPWLESRMETFVTATTLYTQCLGGVYEKFTAFDGRRIGNVMRNLGWKRMPGWDKEKQNAVRGYRKVKIDVDKSDIDDILET